MQNLSPNICAGVIAKLRCSPLCRWQVHIGFEKFKRPSANWAQDTARHHRRAAALAAGATGGGAAGCGRAGTLVYQSHGSTA